MTDLLYGFNSTLVRLKVEIIAKANLAIYLFQFHAGSIKGAYNVGTILIVVMFQFHAGSIKVVLIVAFLLLSRGFNSTLVRLKRFPRGRSVFQVVSIPRWFD